MKNRLDKILITKGFTHSRERARALIMEGKVLVNCMPVTKAGAIVDDGASVELKGEDIPYVSRGGLKLEAALRHFSISLTGKTAMDIGSSTGGFTDCLLQHGAGKVYCVDVGYGQLAWRLRKDKRVVLFERTNIRYLGKEDIADIIDIITVDVSFISLLKVAPKANELLKDKGEFLALIKPQFEVGRADVGKGGLVRDEGKRLAAVESVREGLELAGFMASGILESPVRGQKGNIEYFIYMKKGA